MHKMVLRKHHSLFCKYLELCTEKNPEESNVQYKCFIWVPVVSRKAESNCLPSDTL